MARFQDILVGLKSHTSRKADELTRDLAELNKLRPSWQRYQELSKQVEANERLVKIGYALLFNTPMKGSGSGDPYSGPDEDFAAHEELAIDPNELAVTNFSLWRLIREVVRQSAEIRVHELEMYLKKFGIKASRSAIESAFETHPKEFRVSKRGREKFVSLK